MWWVIPIDQTSTARFASPSARANSSTSATVTPAAAASSATDCCSSRRFRSSKPVVAAAMNSVACQPRSTITFAAAVRKARSPPTFTRKVRSLIFVPNSAELAVDGTQYRSIPGSA